MIARNEALVPYMPSQSQNPTRMPKNSPRLDRQGTGISPRKRKPGVEGTHFLASPFDVQAPLCRMIERTESVAAAHFGI